MPYDDMLIATGAQPRRLPVAEQSCAGVAFLRTDDTRALVSELTGQVLIIDAQLDRPGDRRGRPPIRDNLVDPLQAWVG